MRIFLTGATGYVGAGVVEALLRGGHEITALVRTPGKAEAIAHAAIRTIVGDLSRPERYAAAAAECDAIVHTAFEHSKGGQAIDRLAIETLLGAAQRRHDGG